MWTSFGRALAAVVSAVVLLLGASACTGSPSSNQASPDQSSPGAASGAPSGATSYADVVERVAPSAVTVRTSDGVGSGVVFKSDVVLTNQHVVGTQSQVTVRFADGGSSPGVVLAADQISDLAVIRTDRKNLPVADFRKDLPRPGDVVLAIGSPLGFENTVSEGIVSGLHRNLPASENKGQPLTDLLQTDAPISPGNSGGALVDASGKVIGINEAYIPPSAGAVAIGFAIPSGTAVDNADKLMSTGRVDHPYLGVSLGDLTPSIRDRFGVKVDHGALVLGVDDNGPAAVAGMKVGDVIVRVDNKDVRGVEDVLTAVRSTKPGQQVPVTVARGDQRQDLSVTIAPRPQ
jgi:serine protease Do